MSLKKDILKKFVAATLVVSTAAPTLIASTAIVSVSSTPAEAACYGYGSYNICTDGSSYSTYGNSYYAYNSRTGTSWGGSTYGNTSYGYSYYSSGGSSNWSYGYYGGYGSGYSWSFGN